MIAFSSVFEFEVRLPNGNMNRSLLNLFIEIRDRFDCVSEYNLTSVIVQSYSSTFNSLIQLLLNGNENTIGQILISLSQQFNQINMEALRNTAWSISLHSVNDEYLSFFSRWEFSLEYLHITIGK